MSLKMFHYLLSLIYLFNISPNKVEECKLYYWGVTMCGQTKYIIKDYCTLPCENNTIWTGSNITCEFYSGYIQYLGLKFIEYDNLQPVCRCNQRVTSVIHHMSSLHGVTGLSLDVDDTFRNTFNRSI